MLGRDSSGSLDLDSMSPISTGVNTRARSKDLDSDGSGLIGGDEVLTHRDLGTVERRGGPVNIWGDPDSSLAVLAAGNSTSNCTVWCCHFEPPTAVRPCRAGRSPLCLSQRRRRRQPRPRLQPERPRQ